MLKYVQIIEINISNFKNRIKTNKCNFLVLQIGSSLSTKGKPKRWNGAKAKDEMGLRPKRPNILID